MITRELAHEEKDQYNQLVNHPMQSWEWGDFREQTGVVVKRFGNFENDKLVSCFQIFFHPIPYTGYSIGYFPKGPMPTVEMLEAIKEIAQKQNCIFVKLEPNVPVDSQPNFSIHSFCKQFPHLRESKKPLFTKYTFVLDLTKSETELMSQMKEKTRYNVRLAQKKGVLINEDNSKEAFTQYLKLTDETTKRQNFFAHNSEYHKTMWQTLRSENNGMAHLFTATYENEIITTWIVLLFNNVLYYPYGASAVKFREVMANNLMLWETALWGKKNGATTYDLWGSLGPDPNPKDPWYGFHRFKEGYNPKLTECIGSYDLVINSPLYPLYNLADSVRWMTLKAKRLFWSIPPLW